MNNHRALRCERIFLKGITLLAIVSLTACASEPRVKMAPGYEDTPTPIGAQANVMGTPEPTEIPPTPTPEPLQLDNNLYTMSSKAMSFKPPVGWTAASESSNYVRFEAPDKRAWMEAAFESSGYELTQEDFQKYCDNMLTALYRETDSYKQSDRQVVEGQATYTSSLIKDGTIWFAYDIFIQRGPAIYSFSFQTIQMLWDAYLPGFQSVVDSLGTSTGYVTADLIYSFMRPYTSQNNQFTLTIPMSWTFEIGQKKIKGTLLDTAIAPDGQAGVEIVAYDGTQDLKTLDVVQIATPILKELEDKNLRTRSNDLLNDGRIRLNWQIDAKAVQGYSFIWQDANNIIYIMTLRYANKYAGTYKEVIDNIGDSFNFVKGS